MKRSLVAIITMFVLVLVPTSAMAASENICVPTGPNEPVISTKTSGTSCRTGYTLVAPVPTVLTEIAPYISFTKEGIDGKPTIRVTGANIQVLSGAGEEDITNGMGNLVIGYDEEPGYQGGSNNLVVGSGQYDRSYGSILGGSFNHAQGPFSDVFGYHNWAGNAGPNVSVAGGYENEAENEFSFIGGGAHNITRGESSSIDGGEHNKISTGGTAASISGGESNEVTTGQSVVVGGEYNTTSGNGFNVVVGGYYNLIQGGVSNSILGGEYNTLGCESGAPGCSYSTFPE